MYCIALNTINFVAEEFLILSAKFFFMNNFFSLE